MRIESIQFDVDQRTLWDQIVRNKSDSPIVEDRASIFLGIDMDTLAPVCFPRSTLDLGH
ncbi:MAG: hypothetical protein L0Z53_18625 [Acidobacteriales bacterium]|nr:hypothetical protein [Terriglobales bacterium]